jgi:Fe-S-cluster containining protein
VKKTKIRNEPKKTKKITLKDKLAQIYNTADLRTTCAHNCSCCKVACPSMNFSEYTQLMQEIWDKESKERKSDLICKSLEYFFHNDFNKFGMETMVKPCMLLDDKGMCSYYESRPLNCRLYGLWPEDVYKARVDRFEKAYQGLLTRDQLPLNTQCPNVRRVDPSKPLTKEVFDEMFARLDDLDRQIIGFSNVQIKNRENYRTLHDWILYKIFGSETLSNLTTFMMAANKETIADQLEQIKIAARARFSKDMPKIT